MRWFVISYSVQSLRLENFGLWHPYFCVTDRRWLAVLRQPDGNIILDSAPFECALLVALTIVLLHGALKIDFAKEGRSLWFYILIR